MVKFLLPRHNIACAKTESYRCGNHVPLAKFAEGVHRASMFKILVKCNSVKFDENSRRIRIDFAQKRRFIANDSFKPIC
jgi:hypothetical protein